MRGAASLTLSQLVGAGTRSRHQNIKQLTFIAIRRCASKVIGRADVLAIKCLLILLRNLFSKNVIPITKWHNIFYYNLQSTTGTAINMLSHYDYSLNKKFKRNLNIYFKDETFHNSRY